MSLSRGQERKGRRKGAGRAFDWRRPSPGGVSTHAALRRNHRVPSPTALETPRCQKFPGRRFGYIYKMFQNASRERVRRLADEGAQLVEVLERRQYELAHLPGAVHIPAWELTPARATELDPTRAVVVYCFDTL